MALTDTALKALKPRDKSYTVADSRGPYVEVFPTGGIAWRYRYRLNAKAEKLTLGRYPALTLKNSRAKRDEAAQSAAMGTSHLGHPSWQRRAQDSQASPGQPVPQSLKQNDEWSLNRRYMQLEGPQTVSDTFPTRLSTVAR